MIERRFFPQEYSVIRIALREAMQKRKIEIEKMNFERRKYENESEQLKRHNDNYIRFREEDITWMRFALDAMQ